MKKIILFLCQLAFASIVSSQQPNTYSFRLPGTYSIYIYTGTNSVNFIYYSSGLGCPLLETKVMIGTDYPPTEYTLYGNSGSDVEVISNVTQTGLSPNTTYNYQIWTTNCFGTRVLDNYDFTTDALYSMPYVTTADASNIEYNSGRINGNVTSDGGSSVTSRGFRWGTSNPPYTQVTSGSGTGTYYYDLSGLSIATYYYFQAFATNSEGTSYGQILSFQTGVPSGGSPIVNTKVASGVTTTNAASGGNVLSDANYPPVSERGVVWGTSPNPTKGNSYLSSGSGLGEFTIALSGLTPSATYYYRSYAINTFGTGYGTEYSFTTLSASSAPTVVTNTVTGILAHGFTMNGYVTNQGSSAVTVRGFVYSSSDATPEIGESGVTNTTSGSGTGAFSSVIWSGGLIPCNTIYYTRAYAINSHGTSYGSVSAVTTTSETFAFAGVFIGQLIQSGTTIPVTDRDSAIRVADSLTVNTSRQYSFSQFRLITLSNGNTLHDNTQCIERLQYSRWYTVVSQPIRTDYQDIWILRLDNGVVADLEKRY